VRFSVIDGVEVLWVWCGVGRWWVLNVWWVWFFCWVF